MRITINIPSALSVCRASKDTASTSNPHSSNNDVGPGNPTNNRTRRPRLLRGWLPPRGCERPVHVVCPFRPLHTLSSPVAHTIIMSCTCMSSIVAATSSLNSNAMSTTVRVVAPRGGRTAEAMLSMRSRARPKNALRYPVMHTLGMMVAACHRCELDPARNIKTYHAVHAASWSMLGPTTAPKLTTLIMKNLSSRSAVCADSMPVRRPRSMCCADTAFGNTRDTHCRTTRCSYLHQRCMQQKHSTYHVEQQKRADA